MDIFIKYKQCKLQSLDILGSVLTEVKEVVNLHFDTELHKILICCSVAKFEFMLIVSMSNCSVDRCISLCFGMSF